MPKTVLWLRSEFRKTERRSPLLPKGARIVTHQFDIPAWKSDREIDYLQKNGQTEKIYLYTKK